MATNNIQVLRGDVFYADLSPTVGFEQSGVRPVVIVQNDLGNRHAPTVIIAPITSKMKKTDLPTHVVIDDDAYIHGMVLLEQVRIIDKSRLSTRVAHLSPTKMDEINCALKISLGLV